MSDSTIVADEDDDAPYSTVRTDKAGLRAGILAAHASIERATTGREIAALEDDIAAGEWTARDIVGHLADWDARTRIGIRHSLAGTDARELVIDDFDPLNSRMVAIRRERGDRWDDVCRDLSATVKATLALLDSVNEAQLALPARLPWGRMATLLDAFGVFEYHVGEHHDDLLAGQGASTSSSALSP